MKTIGQAAKLAGISSDTLRHWDRVGLLAPSGRTDAGYRMYSDDDMRRLDEVLTWKSLGFALSQIQALLDDPDGDRTVSLREQKTLAVAQRDRFNEIARGLDSALNGPVDPGDSTPESNPGRVVASDLVRLGESLLALGVLPVGVGTVEDRFTGERDVQAWPPLVEAAVSKRIASAGYYGSDAGRLRQLQPDLIVDLTNGIPGESLVDFWSDGQCRLSTLCDIAPTSLVRLWPEDDRIRPTFQHLVMATAQLIGRTGRAVRLLQAWEARVRAMRIHLEGVSVGVVAYWDARSPFQGCDLFSPLEHFPTNVLPQLGVQVVAPMKLERVAKGFVGFDRSRLPDIRADTVFLNTCYRSHEQVAALVESEPFRQMPAVQHGRVFQFGGEFARSGWFSAHWQMLVIARAFGLSLLRAGDGETEVFAVLDSRRGRLSVSAAQRDRQVVLHGPGLHGIRIDLPQDGVADLVLPADVADDLHAVPELYWLDIADGPSEARFGHDRESAIARLSSLADAA